MRSFARCKTELKVERLTYTTLLHKFTPFYTICNPFYTKMVAVREGIQVMEQMYNKKIVQRFQGVSGWVHA